MASAVKRKAVERALYPWHRRQRPGWEIAMWVDMEVLQQCLSSAAKRRPQRKLKAMPRRRIGVHG